MINKRIQEFSELSFDKQKTKLISMLEQLQDPEWFFKQVSNTIKTSNQITSQNLVLIYQDIIEFGEELQNLTKEEEKNLMSKLQQKVLNIRKKEKKEREAEKPDDLLDDMLKGI